MNPEEMKAWASSRILAPTRELNQGPGASFEGAGDRRPPPKEKKKKRKKKSKKKKRKKERRELYE